MRFTHYLRHLAILLSCFLYLAACSSSGNQSASQTSPASSSSSSVTPATPVNETSQPKPLIDSFPEGVNKATNASKLAQTARAVDEWSKVALEWEAAVSLMQSVPSSSSNYKVARQRVAIYQKNLSYAQQNANRLKQEQEKILKAQIIRGEKVFKNLNGIYQTAGEATATPVVRVVIPKDGWNKLSKTDQISLTMYAQSLIPVVKANLCQDCWSIIVSNTNSQPYGIDETVAQGDTPWLNDEPCCRGIKSSEFRK